MFVQLILEIPNEEYTQLALNVKLGRDYLSNSDEVIAALVGVATLDGQFVNWLPSPEQWASALRSLQWAVNNEPFPVPHEMAIINNMKVVEPG